MLSDWRSPVSCDARSVRWDRLPSRQDCTSTLGAPGDQVGSPPGWAGTFVVTARSTGISTCYGAGPHPWPSGSRQGNASNAPGRALSSTILTSGSRCRVLARRIAAAPATCSRSSLRHLARSCSPARRCATFDIAPRRAILPFARVVSSVRQSRGLLSPGPQVRILYDPSRTSPAHACAGLLYRDRAQAANAPLARAAGLCYHLAILRTRSVECSSQP